MTPSRRNGWSHNSARRRGLFDNKNLCYCYIFKDLDSAMVHPGIERKNIP